jgi:hypothetical protein
MEPDGFPVETDSSGLGLMDGTVGHGDAAEARNWRHA